LSSMKNTSMTNGRSSVMGLLRVQLRTEKQTHKDLHYLHSLSLQQTDQCVTILTCPFHQKLIPQGDHLVKGCKCWRENRTIFAPEAT